MGVKYCISDPHQQYFSTRQRKQVPSLPVVNSVAQRRVTIAIFSIDSGTVTQKVVDCIQVALTGSNMQGCAAIVVFQTQVTAL